MFLYSQVHVIVSQPEQVCCLQKHTVKSNWTRWSRAGANYRWRPCLKPWPLHAGVPLWLMNAMLIRSVNTSMGEKDVFLCAGVGSNTWRHRLSQGQHHLDMVTTARLISEPVWFIGDQPQATNEDVHRRGRCDRSTCVLPRAGRTVRFGHADARLNLNEPEREKTTT